MPALTELFEPLPWLILTPLAWASLAFLLGPGRGTRLALAGTSIQFALALQVAASVLTTGTAHHAVGGWGAPLGIDLAADGLAAVFLLLTQSVALPLAIYARAYFARAATEGRFFWPLTGFLLAGLNALFLSTDLFNLYVTLEIIGLAAVGLVAIGGAAAHLAAALRYLFATLLGSAAYLLGVALIYGGYGTVSMPLLTPLVPSGPLLLSALAGLLMLSGLLLKTALFPLHYWLPPAHGGAPAPVSALLSALVVKASFYLILRLWLGPFAPFATLPLGAAGAWLLALAGGAAILWGSWQAIRTPRLKALIAYSTVAQLGYLFLVFPLLGAGSAAVQAAMLQVVAHGLAKAGMFAAAGVLIKATGQDTVAGLGGTADKRPLTLFAFALAGMTLMGLPPSGGFLAKWLLIEAALAQGQWPLVALVLAGGLLAAVYVFRVVRLAFLVAPTHLDHAPADKAARVPHGLEWAAFLLAAASVAIGLRSVELVELVELMPPLTGGGAR